VFYPDGDESGTLSQADIIAVSIESSIIGATAVLEVYSVGGELIRTQRESIASTTTVSMEWDGRDELGAVQASGVWSLDTYIEDNNGNPSDVCSIDVALRQNIMDY
jgi:flagellar hook assembly protein FlgD